MTTTKIILGRATVERPAQRGSVRDGELGTGEISVPVPCGRLGLLDHIDPDAGWVTEAEATLAERLVSERLTKRRHDVRIAAWGR